jgi:hypothetical protein
MIRYVAERISYDKLFRMSEPKRVIRSHKVKGPPLEIDSFQDAVYYAYNFKSHPSTTGLRHRGYVKFLKPRHGGQKPLQHLDCIVDCTCPDFRYRWAWANKQRGASRVGAQSLNQALNRAPRRTNPTSAPGLCKHILAARSYIYGLLSSFPNDTPDTADKLNKLTQFATRRWINFPQQMAAAKERDQLAAQARAARNIGQEPIPAEEPLDLGQPGHEPGDDEAYAEIVPPEIRDAPELAQVPPPPQSFAANIAPPGARGRTVPTGKAPQAAPPKPKRIQKRTDQLTPDKSASVSKSAGFSTPAEYNFRRRQGLGDSLGYGNEKEKTNSVVTMNGLKNMNTLTEAQRIISELEQDELAALRNAGNEDEGGPGGAGDLPPVGDQGGGEFPPEAGGGPEMGGGDPMGGEMGGGPEMGGDLPPSEPPMSDSAAGPTAKAPQHSACSAKSATSSASWRQPWCRRKSQEPKPVDLLHRLKVKVPKANSTSLSKTPMAKPVKKVSAAATKVVASAKAAARATRKRKKRKSLPVRRSNQTANRNDFTRS